MFQPFGGANEKARHYARIYERAASAEGPFYRNILSGFKILATGDFGYEKVRFPRSV